MSRQTYSIVIVFLEMSIVTVFFYDVLPEKKTFWMKKFYNFSFEICARACQNHCDLKEFIVVDTKTVKMGGKKIQLK